MQIAKLLLLTCLLMVSAGAFAAPQVSAEAKDEKSCANFVQGVLEAYERWGGNEQKTGYSVEEIKRIQQEKGSCAAQDRISEARRK